MGLPIFNTTIVDNKKDSFKVGMELPFYVLIRRPINALDKCNFLLYTKFNEIVYKKNNKFTYYKEYSCFVGTFCNM